MILIKGKIKQMYHLSESFVMVKKDWNYKVRDPYSEETDVTIPQILKLAILHYNLQSYCKPKRMFAANQCT